MKKIKRPRERTRSRLAGSILLIIGVLLLGTIAFWNYAPDNLTAPLVRLQDSVMGLDMGTISRAGNLITGAMELSIEAQGDEVVSGWNKTYDFGGVDRAHSIAVDSLNNVYVVGDDFPGSLDGSWHILKFNSSGTEDVTNWNKTYNYSISLDTPYSVTVDSLNNVYVVGTGNDDWHILKFNSSGSEFTTSQGWNKTYNFGGVDRAYSVAIDSLDNVYVVGDSNSAQNWRILKFNSSGTEDSINWNKTYNFGGADTAKSVAVDSLDNIYVVGNGGVSYSDWHILKFNKSGTEDTANWNKTYNFSIGNDKAYSVAIDSLDNIYVVGSSGDSSPSDDQNWNILKFNSSGAEDVSNWNKTYIYDDPNSLATGVSIDFFNNVYVVGYDTAKGRILKFNSDGREDATNWNISSNYFGGNLDGSIVVDFSNNVYVAGSKNNNWSILKFEGSPSCGNVTTSIILDANLTVNGTCFTIAASNIVLDGAGYTITGNGSGYGINGSSGLTNVTIKNFAGINNFTNGIFLSTLVNFTIFNNTVISANSTDAYGIYLLVVNQTNISSNSINTSGTTSAALNIQTGSNNSITYNNIFTLGTASHGMVISISNNSISFNNYTTYGSGSNGMLLSSASQNTISSNKILRLAGATGPGPSDGILLSSGAHYNELSSNNVTLSSSGNDRGIVILNGASNNSFRYNQIWTYYGSALDLSGNSEGNLFVNNNFTKVGDTGLVSDTTGNSYVNYLVYNNSFGEINWIDNGTGSFSRDLTLSDSTYRGIGLGLNLFISNNTISLNTSAFTSSNINSSANITLYGLNLSVVNEIKKLSNYTANSTLILQQGTNCLRTTCTNLSYSGGTLVFNTTSFSSFAASLDTAPNTTQMIINATSVNNYTTDNLTCYVNVSDIDGGTVWVNYTWYNNSIEVTSLRGQVSGVSLNTLTLITTLDNGNTTKGQNWTCSVQADDGTLYEGDWNNATILIRNTAPVTSLANITSNQAGFYSNSTLIGWCNASDADADLLSYDTKWYKNNTLYEEPTPAYIAAGLLAHTCGILTNSSAYCWGYNSEGQLGYGGTDNQNNPIAVNISSTFKSISAGQSHTCGLLTNGSAMCWGFNSEGQLGYGGTTQQNNPIAVNISSTFKSISAGQSHTCGILTNGSAYCWGYGADGRLGYGGTSDQYNPKAVNISSTFKSISAGYQYTCGILTNGSAYCWGDGNFGRLGYGGTSDQYNPKAVNISSTFKSLSAGGSHTCGILTNGSAYCWGYGADGSLGYGGTNNQLNPVAVNISSTFKSISASDIHTCSIVTNGSAYCWGWGAYGQLGYGGTTQQYNPIAVNISSTFKSISAGQSHTCGVLTNGSAHCWGRGNSGQLGYGGTSNQNNSIAVNISATMWPLFTQGVAANIWNITAGLMVNDTWNLECAANDATTSSSALNSSNITITIFTNTAPNTTQMIINATSVNNYTTDNITCYANVSDIDGGTVWVNYTWYNNSIEVTSLRGQVSGVSLNILTLITTLDNGNTTKGQNWTCSVQADDGTLYEGDWNNATILIRNTAPVTSLANITSNQAGFYSNSTLIGWCNASDTDGDLLSYDTKWYKNSVLYEQNIPEYIDGGGSHSCGILTNGSAYCWGQGSLGQLGNGLGTSSNNSVAVSISSTFKSISTGGSFSCGILTNGSAYCWGAGGLGRLGYGSISQQNNPIAVNISSAFKSISAGGTHACGILTNGSAYCWGYGADGSLGYGGTNNQLNPVAVNISSTFKSISAGYYHTCGILTNGSAYCWGGGSSGSTNFGQLGNGNTSQQNNPIVVNISSTFKFISTSGGGVHTCGILTNGSAYCWGLGGNGQLGYGGISQQNNPIAVNISSTFKSISAGGTHACGILTNGSAYCWGDGSYGQLGYGGTTQQNNPKVVNRSTTLKSISAGYFHTCSILTNGSAYCWGLGTDGQLGYGGADQQNNPIAVNITSTMYPLFTQSILTNVWNITYGLTKNANWTLECTANDGTSSSASLNSSLIIILNTAPTHNTPILNATNVNNNTLQNLTAYNQSTADLDSNTILNILNWKRNDAPIAVLNMPFTGGSNSTFTKDYSGFGNNGSVVNATWNATGGPDGEGAYEFDGVSGSGSSDRIDLSSTPSLNITGAISIETWVKFNSLDDRQKIFYRGDEFQNDVQYSLGIHEYSPTIQFFINPGGSLSQLLSSALSTNVWYHVVATYNNSFMGIYINGVLNSSNSSVTIPLQSASPSTRIGGLPGGSVYDVLNGSLAELRVYNRSLSAEQILALYQNSTSLIHTETQKGENWTVEITPNDGEADGVMRTSNQVIITNTAPIQNAAISNVSFIQGSPSTLNLSNYFYEPDGEEINYSLPTVSGLTLSMNNTNKLLTISAASSLTANVTVNASDGTAVTSSNVFWVIVSAPSGGGSQREEVVPPAPAPAPVPPPAPVPLPEPVILPPVSEATPDEISEGLDSGEFVIDITPSPPSVVDSPRTSTGGDAVAGMAAGTSSRRGSSRSYQEILEQKVRVVLANNGDKKLVLDAPTIVNEEYTLENKEKIEQIVNDPNKVLALTLLEENDVELLMLKSTSFFGLFKPGVSVSGIKATRENIAGTLLQSKLVGAEESLVLNPGEKLEKNFTIRKGISAKARPIKIVFTSLGEKVYETEVNPEDTVIGAAVDVNQKDKMIDVYLVVPPEINQNEYWLEMEVTKENTLNQTTGSLGGLVGGTVAALNTPSYFNELFGPYKIKNSTSDNVIFAQQLGYDAKTYYGKGTITTKIFEGKDLVATNEFQVDFGEKETLVQFLGGTSKTITIILSMFIVLVGLLFLFYGYQKGFKELRLLTIKAKAERELLIGELNKLDPNLLYRETYLKAIQGGKLDWVRQELSHVNDLPLEKTKILTNLPLQHDSVNVLNKNIFTEKKSSRSKFLQLLQKSLNQELPFPKASVLKGTNPSKLLETEFKDVSEVLSHVNDPHLDKVKVLTNLPIQHEAVKVLNKNIFAEKKPFGGRFLQPQNRDLKTEPQLPKTSLLRGIKPNPLLEKELQKVNKSLLDVHQLPPQKNCTLNRALARVQLKEKLPVNKPLPILNIPVTVSKKRADQNKKIDRELAEINQKLSKLGSR